MAAERFVREWKLAGGWIVRKPTTILKDGSLPLDGQKLTFVGDGNGGTDSLLRLDGEDWGEKCSYNEDDDTLTYYLDEEQFVVTHNGSASPPTLEADPVAKARALTTLGGWTADDGSAGGGGGKGDPHGGSAERRRHRSARAPEGGERPGV